MTYRIPMYNQRNRDAPASRFFVSGCAKMFPGCWEMFKDVPSSSLQFLLCSTHLRQRGKSVIVLSNVRIVNSAVVLRHLQCAVSQQLLEHERIAAAVYQILPGEGMAVEMCASFLHATGLVMPCDGQPQAVHGEHTAVLIAEQEVLRLAATDRHVLPEDGHHRRAKRGGLDSSVLIVPEDDLPGVQVHMTMKS